MELQVKNATEALIEVQVKAAAAQERLLAAEAEIKEVSLLIPASLEWFHSNYFTRCPQTPFSIS